MTTSDQGKPAAAPVDDTGLPKIVVFKGVTDPVEATRARYRFEVRTAPQFEDDTGRWVGDLTLSNVNPYSSRPLRQAIADWQHETGTSGRADPGPNEPHAGKELSWTVESSSSCCNPRGWGRRVDILAPRMSPPSPLSLLTRKIGSGHWSWVGRHGQPNAPGFMSSSAWVRLSAHPCSCLSS
jgi:hypothetical protein